MNIKDEIDHADHKKWYVLHARSGFEQKAIDALRERARVLGFESDIGEMVIPTEEVIEMRFGKRKKVSRKFFPGYILAQIALSDSLWYMIRETPYVLNFIGDRGGRPVPISSRDVNAILKRVEDGADRPRPKILFSPGEVVRIKQGPFADFTGTVETVNFEKSRLHVSVLIFSRSTSVEIEFTQVEKC